MNRRTSSSNRVARTLRQQTTMTIGVLVPNTAEPLYAELVHGVSAEASVAGYEIILGHTDNNPHLEQHHLSRMLDRQIDGLIVVPDDEHQLREYQHVTIPFVTVNRQMPLGAEDPPSIELDNQQAGYLATRHLLGLGHTEIAIITTRDNNRYIGYLRALKEARIPVRDSLIGYIDNSTANLIDQGRRAMQTLLTRTVLTACFVVDDLRAIGALEAIHARRLSAPHDVALVGCGDLQAAQLSRPQLTTIGHAKRSLGVQAMRLLLDLFQNTPTEPRVVMPVELVVRESCGAIMRPVGDPLQWLR